MDGLSVVDANEVASWIVAQYSGQAYPAVVIGSPHGSAAHLAVALWYLVCYGPDEGGERVRAGIKRLNDSIDQWDTRLELRRTTAAAPRATAVATCVSRSAAE